MPDNLVVNEQGNAPVDTAKVPLTEAAPEQSNLDSLSSILTAAPANTDPAQTAPQASDTKEPGWFQTRMAKERQKWEAEQEEKLAPIRQSMWDREAAELVQRGEVKSIELAKELVYSRHGTKIVSPQTTDTANRDDKGRFAQSQETPSQSEKVDPTVRARAETLMAQARLIKATGGPDVLAEYRSNPEIAKLVNSGNCDFRDVAEAMGGSRRNAGVPAPVRSPNGAGFAPSDIAHMSAEQFRQLEDNLKKGKKYDLRK